MRKARPTADSSAAPSECLLPRNALSFKATKPAHKAKLKRNLKQVLAMEPSEQLRTKHEQIDAPPSAYPPKKYCDITGYEARYRDPRTGLLYADTHAYASLRRLSNKQIATYRGIRFHDEHSSASAG